MGSTTPRVVALGLLALALWVTDAGAATPADIDQIGSGSRAVISQTGAGNHALIDQSQGQGSGSIFQSGDDNTSDEVFKE